MEKRYASVKNDIRLETNKKRDDFKVEQVGSKVKPERRNVSGGSHSTKSAA